MDALGSAIRIDSRGREVVRILPRLNEAGCMGVGGRFDFWAGNVSRAPQRLRRTGHEWLWRLWQQPRQKAGRYLIGNPLFLGRVLREQWRTPRNRKRL